MVIWSPQLSVKQKADFSFLRNSGKSIERERESLVNDGFSNRNRHVGGHARRSSTRQLRIDAVPFEEAETDASDQKERGAGRWEFVALIRSMNIPKFGRG